MQENKVKNLNTNLADASFELERALHDFQKINHAAHFIGLCASIEGARMRAKLPTFSIVANQIAAQAEKNNVLIEKLRELIDRIKNQVLESISVRNLELAADLIDKLDRNLFERNCDVQAWASFDEIKVAAIATQESACHAAHLLLEKLVSIYVVYLDSFLVLPNGVAIATAKDQSMVGKNFSSRDWFAPTLSGQFHVSDVYFNEDLKSFTVAYCSPVLSGDGSIIGVLANFFDWNYALEMIHSGGYSEETKALFVNSDATVIGSSRKAQILRDSYDWLKAGELASAGWCGHTIERARNGDPIAVGFSRTNGYNAYRGKGWSAVICETIASYDFKSQIVTTESRDGSFKARTEREIESERSGRTLFSTMKEVDDLVFSINENTREVKLLAVNAAIQAGLAGADGEGFSVISNDVATFSKNCLSFVESVNRTTSGMRKAVEQSSFIRLVDAARDTMSKIDRNLFERYCDIQAWSKFEKCQQILSTGAKGDAEGLALFAKIHKIYEVYHDIYILNSEGDVVISAVDAGILGANFNTTTWFKNALSGHISVSDIYESPILQLPVITFSAPIYDAEGHPIGVVASQFNCKFLDGILSAALIDSASHAYLINHEGKVIGSSDANFKFLTEFAGFDKISNNGTEARTGYFEAEAGKDKRLFSMGFAHSGSYNTYKGQEWVTVIRKPNMLVTGEHKMTPEERFESLFSNAKKLAHS